METKEAHATRQRAYLKTPAGRGTSFRYYEKHVKPRLTPHQKFIVHVLEFGGRLVVSLSLKVKPYGWHANLFNCSGMNWDGKISMSTFEALVSGERDRTITLIKIDTRNQELHYGIPERKAS